MNPTSTTSSDKNRRVLQEDLFVTWTVDGNLFGMRVPMGYQYEVSGSSLFHAILVAIGPYYSGEDVAAGHDWAYDRHGDVEAWVHDEGGWDLLRRPLTKAEIDEIMRSDPEDPEYIQALLYAGVRLFGWWKWNGWEKRKRRWLRRGQAWFDSMWPFTGKRDRDCTGPQR